MHFQNSHTFNSQTVRILCPIRFNYPRLTRQCWTHFTCTDSNVLSFSHLYFTTVVCQKVPHTPLHVSSINYTQGHKKGPDLGGPWHFIHLSCQSILVDSIQGGIQANLGMILMRQEVPWVYFMSHLGSDWSLCMECEKLGLKFQSDSTLPFFLIHQYSYISLLSLPKTLETP